MSRGTSDRNLLVGMLAFQNGFVRREQLLSAMSAWLVDKETRLEEILLREGALNSDQQQLLIALVRQHLAMHDNIAQQSLEAISSVGSVRDALCSLADSELNASLFHVTIDHEHRDDFATRIPATIGARTSQGSRFRILRPHARGGLGEVHVALDSELNREVALKEIQAPYADRPDSRARFTLEAEVTGGLEHPGIVPIYGLGTYADGRPYYAMRFIRGDSLKEALERYHQAGNARSGDERLFELRKLLGRFIDVCNAIEYAHSRGVLHRDLKPGNIMLGKYGETLVVDWGLAKPLGRRQTSAAKLANSTLSLELPLVPSSGSGAAPTLMGSAMGTPAYMSPEQAAGRLDQLGFPSDVYSLGATLYHVLTGRPPFEPPEDMGELLQKIKRGDFRTPRSLSSRIPKALEAVCLKAMAIDPMNRYSSAQSLADDVERWLADEPVQAYSESVVERTARYVRRHRQWTFSAAVILLMLAVVSAAAAVAVLLIVAGVSIAAALAIGQRNKENARLAAVNLDLAKKEKEARHEAEGKQRESQVQAARLLFEQGWSKHTNGNDVHALLSMASSLVGVESVVTIENDWHVDLARRAGELSLSIRDHILSLAISMTTMRHVLCHEDSVTSIAFRPDGQMIATGSCDNTVRLWDPATGMPLGEVRHQDRVTAVLFTSDGATLGTASRDGCVQLWDVSRLRALCEPLIHSEPVNAIAFSPDGHRLITSAGKRAGVWDARTGQRLHCDIVHDDEIYALAFSADGTTFGTGSRDGTARLWSSSTGEPLHPPFEHGEAVFSVVFNPDGHLFATGSHDNTARVWDVQTGQPILEPLQHSNTVSGLAFTRDGTRLATASHDNTARLWNVATGQLLGQPLHHSEGVHSVAFSPDDNTLATVTRDGVAQLWHVTSGHPIGEPLQHVRCVNSVQFSPDGVTLASASQDGTARIWNIGETQPLAAAFQHRDAVTAADFSPSGDKIAVADRVGDVSIWDVASGMLSRAPIHHEAPVFSTSYSPDAKTLATASGNAAYLWNVESGELLHGPLQHDDVVYRVCFSSDGTRIATASYDNTACVWDVSSGARVFEPLKHEYAVTAVSFSPDDKMVATASRDQTACLWDASTGAVLSGPLMHEGSVKDAVFSPDGTMLATASDDNTARLWNADGGRCLKVIPHSHAVRNVVFSPDGRKLATASEDNTARLWDVSTGHAIGDAMKHDNVVRALAFSPDSSRVATASWDKTARIWDTTLAKPLSPSLVHGQRVSVAFFSRKGHLFATGSRDTTLQLWDVPKHMTEPARSVFVWVQVLTGATLSDTGDLRPLRLRELRTLQEELRQSIGIPNAYREAIIRRKGRYRAVNARGTPDR